MKLVIEYIDGTKDITTDIPSWKNWEEALAVFRKGLGNMDFYTINGPVWVQGSSIKRIYPKKRQPIRDWLFFE